MKLSLQPVHLMMEFGDETGYLVSVDGRLAAVLVRLDAEFHGSDRGSWNVEAAFGSCDARVSQPFPRLADAVAWVGTQVGAAPASAEEAVRSVANGEQHA